MPATVHVTRRPRRPAALVVGLLTCLGVLSATPPAEAGQATAPPAEAGQVPAGAPRVAQAPPARNQGHARTASVSARGTTDVDALRLIGTRTRVVVGRVSRRGQVLWIDHVLDDRLVNRDGCQARRVTATPRRQVYRASVYAVCPGAAGTADAAARALVRSRPWYRVQVQRLPLVGFTLLAAEAEGNDRAVPAAVRTLPSGPSVFFEGDDVSLAYAGPGVTQTRLDAAIEAFAHALGVPTSQVTVSPLG